MIKKRIKVAVIDSGVDIKNPFFKDRDIIGIRIEENKIVENNVDTNGHGTLVSSYIFRECDNISIISIQILDKNNRTSISKLITALDYCIKNGIDIINFSLGINKYNENINKLNEICEEAISKGILIFAAHSNRDELSYPASFKNIIGVGYDKSIKEDIFIADNTEKNIFFSKGTMSMHHFGINMTKPGSSFLCPYIVGLFCKYIEYYGLELGSKNLEYRFFDFINELNKDYGYKIFNLFSEEMSNKNIVYYPKNEANQSVIKSYNYIFNQINFFTPSKRYKNMLNKIDNKTIKKLTNSFDLFVIGNIDYEKERAYAKDLLEIIINYNIDILIRYSFISTFDRYILSKKTGRNIYCQHL